MADQFNCTFSKIKNLVDRWKPKENVPTRLTRKCRLSFEDEALTVGLLLGMANISKPLSISDLLNIVNKRYQGRGKPFTEHWARKFLARWSDWISAKQTRLISAGRSSESAFDRVQAFIAFQSGFLDKFYNPAHAIFNVDEVRCTLNDAKQTGRRIRPAIYSQGGLRGKRDRQYCSVIPFVSAHGEVISVFYCLATGKNQTDLLIPHHVGARNCPSYSEYYLTTATGYTNDEVFPKMMALFERDFHQRYPGLRAVVYMDRLSSHTKGEVLSSMSKKGVILVLFPAGTTQFLQPLDNAVFGGFKAKLRRYRDQDLAAEPLRVAVADNTLLTAMMRALKESLEPGPIGASFANTGIYPWNPEKILEKARLAFPQAEAVPEDLPSPAQEMMKLVSEASPRSNKVAVTRFQQHAELTGKIFNYDDLCSADQRFQEERQAGAAEKAARQAARKEAQAERRRATEEQKRRQEAARAERRRVREQGEADRAKRRRQTGCAYCSSTWKGGAQWLWCDYCDDVCICSGCQNSYQAWAEFVEHEKTHEIA